MQHKLDDLKELEKLLSQSKRVNVQKLLKNEIDKINSEIRMIQNIVQNSQKTKSFEGISKYSWNDEGSNIS